MIRTLGLLAILAVLWGWPLASAAQEAPAGPDAAELEALAAELKDEAKRAEIVRRIEALAAVRRGGEPAAEEPARGPLASVTDSVVTFGGDVAGSLSFAFDPGVFRQWLEQGFNDPVSGTPVWMVLGQALLILLAGFVVEIAVWRLMAGLRRASELPESGSVGERMLAAALGVLLGIVPLAAFAVGSFAALSVAALPETAAELVLAVVYASSAARLAMLAARAVLAPEAAGARLAPLDDAGAAGLLAWLRRLVLAVVYGWLICEVARIFALPSAPYRLLVDLVGLTVLVVAVSMVLRNRKVVQNRLRGDGGGTRARLADIWHVVAVAYLAAVFLVWAAAVEGGFAYIGAASAWTVAAVAAARLADLGVLRLVDAATRWEVRADSRFPGVKARADRYVPVLRKCLRTAVWFIAAIAALEAWRAPVLDLLAAPAGERIVGALVRIALVLGVFLVLWEALCLAIERYLDARDDHGNPQERSGRARTLLPLLRRASAVLLLTVGGLTAASELGIDIAPLLAGVGIAGLAIGFGAQTLVKDVITGLFIVMENQVAVGEYVSVAGHSGTVEALSIRTIRLRDLSGTVHVVPFGEVGTVENLTRDFSYALIDAGVGYSEDTDRVSDVLREIAAGMEGDESWRHRVIPPFEVFGVQELGDSAVIVRCRFKTPPMHQWAVAREFRRRMKKRFDELGIEIPFPHRTVYFGAGKGPEPAAES